MRPSRSSGGRIIESVQPALTFTIADLDLPLPSWTWNGTNPNFWLLQETDDPDVGWSDTFQLFGGVDRSGSDFLPGGVWYRIAASPDSFFAIPPVSNAIFVP